MEHMGGFHICIVVQDFERSKSFYESLGFSSAGQLDLKDDPEIQMQYLQHPSGGLIEIINYRQPRHEKPPALQRDEVGGLNHFGFHVQDLQQVKETLEAQRVEIVEEGSRGKYAYVFARGPDNELVGFAQIIS